jgi:hypothetical protein
MQPPRIACRNRHRKPGVRNAGLLGSTFDRYCPTACFAVVSSWPKALESLIASSERALRLSVTPDFLRPFMKLEYESPRGGRPR